jgi:hypothetical protein
VWLAGQNFQSFEFLKSLGQPRLFNRQFAFHYEKELPSVAMVVRDFRASRRHPFLDHAQGFPIYQLPTIAISSPRVVGRVFARDNFHRGIESFRMRSARGICN